MHPSASNLKTCKLSRVCGLYKNLASPVEDSPFSRLQDLCLVYWPHGFFTTQSSRNLSLKFSEILKNQKH